MNVTPLARRRFLADYAAIRHAEGRGSTDPAYYQALPYQDLSGRNAAMWAMRAATYRYFEYTILQPLENAVRGRLRILDLGAGNCWMSYRLALRGHRIAALDIFRDAFDGLDSARHYPVHITAVEAEFDRLPFRAREFDLVVFNSSLHYSTDYRRTLSDARRVLDTNGKIVILDSPVYRKPRHGRLMAAERHALFERRYGFRSDAIPSLEFLDRPTLRSLARELGLTWEIHRPWYGWGWHLRPLKAFLLGRRPPSQFWILVGGFPDR